MLALLAGTDLPDADYCTAKLAGYRSARVEPPAPTPNKTKSQNGQPVAQHLPTGPPRRNPTFPVNTHLRINNRPGKDRQGKARQGKAHPTESHATAIHSFCIFNIALSPPTQRFFPECCTSCDQIAVSAAQRDCALSPQFPWPLFSIFLLLIFSVSLYVTIPNTDQHTKRAHETSLSV